MESSSSASSSTPMLNSTFRVFPLNPFKPYKLLPFLFFFTILILNFSFTVSLIPILNQDTDVLYIKSCDQIVPRSPLDSKHLSTISLSTPLELRTAYFSGGDRILGKTAKSGSDFMKYLSFRPFHAHKTVSNGIYKVQGSLHLRSSVVYSAFNNSPHRRLRLVRFRGPRILPRMGSTGFSLTGYWSESSRKLCMVGTGTGFMTSGTFQTLHIVLKLNYPKNANILSSLVTGSLKSLDNITSLNYFEPISILGLSQNTNYEYTLTENEIENNEFLSGNEKGANLPQGLCSVFGRRFDKYNLEYGSDCGGEINCNPLGENVGYLPVKMFFQKTQCTDGRKMQMLLSFPNSSYNGYRFPFEPSSTLIAEGIWDQNKNRLSAIACRILDFKESLSKAFVGDCSIKFSLIFPSVFSVRNRNTVVGKIWSNKDGNDSGYFSRFGFQSYQESLMVPLNVKYNYTEVDTMRSCGKDRNTKGKRKTYPNGNSFDMRFDMSVRNRKGQVARGYATPLFVGEQFYQTQIYGRLPLPLPGHAQSAAYELKNNQSRTMSISYKVSLSPPPDFEFAKESFSYKTIEISAEGTYNTETGVLCMTGCFHRKMTNNGSLVDCEIEVSLQFPPLDSNSDHIKGIIESRRLNSDSLYFEHLQLSSYSISTSQAKQSIWRMDLEITMVLVSDTFACIFIILQLFYVKKHPDVLSFISIVMLLVLTLGHMVPLMLNFEALFVGNHNHQNVFSGSGGWIEVNEVIVRVITMVAFLLLLRLLQLTWSARNVNESEKDLWDSEKKVFYRVTLPLYVFGVLITLLVHLWKSSNGVLFPQPHRKNYQLFPLRDFSHQQRSFFEDLKSYAGLVLDGFLFPQILFNLITGSKEKALSPFFYVGITIVRLLPHAYDLYRAQNSGWNLDLSFIYANHKLDFYSTFWDIIIPCGGLLFAFVIFLQHRSGGRCFLPGRCRVFGKSSEYEKVPDIGNEQL